MSFHDLPSDATPAAIRRRQAQFVHELMGSLTRELLRMIRAGKVPPDWDGIELRALIALHAAESATIIKEKHNRRRLREFNRAVLVNNL